MDTSAIRTSLFVTLCMLSASSFGDDKPTTRTYKCLDAGCTISCLSDRDRWSTLASGASQVNVTHYANGNIEFALKHNPKIETTPNTDEVILVSQENLQCKLSGIVLE